MVPDFEARFSESLGLGEERGVGNSRSVLVVDDEPAMRDIVRRAMEAHGWRVVMAGGGFEGFQRFDEGSFDLVVTDLKMPGANGVHFIRAIRSAGSSVPILAVTGSMDHAPNGLIAQALRSGADGLLMKPFSLDELACAVAALMAAPEKSRA